ATMHSSETALTMPPRPGLRYRRATPDFARRTASARKVLVLLWGGLGDIVHSFPALWSIRQAYPQAQLDVLSPGAAIGLLGLRVGLADRPQRREAVHDVAEAAPQ